jgi:glycosyltransferase involved in cell wall biosynthesis
MLKVPVVHTIHGYAFHDYQTVITWWLIYCLELFASFCTTHYICVSRADAKTGLRLFPGFKDRHTIIRAAVEHEKFRRPLAQATLFARAPHSFIFGTISCFKPQKNLTHLIRAFFYVHSIMPHARLEIIGDGQMRHELEQLITSLGLASCVKLYGWQRDVVDIMKNWHTFVLSSLWEGLPCVIVEARLLHIPVVCYDTGGINEIIIHEANGLLAPRNNWHLLAEYMLALVSSQELYVKFQCYQDNLVDFYYATMLEEHDRLYAMLAKKQYTHHV